MSFCWSDIRPSKQATPAKPTQTGGRRTSPVLTGRGGDGLGQHQVAGVLLELSFEELVLDQSRPPQQRFWADRLQFSGRPAWLPPEVDVGAEAHFGIAGLFRIRNLFGTDVYSAQKVESGQTSLSTQCRSPEQSVCLSSPHRANSGDSLSSEMAGSW